MPTLDIAMPIALFVVVVVAVLLNERTQGRLKSTVEKREFKTRDVVFLIVFMVVIVSVLTYATMAEPGNTLNDAILVFFLTSYTFLLFTISYVFSNTSKLKTQVISIVFGSASILVGLVCLLPPFRDVYSIFRLAAFFGLAIFCYSWAVYEQYKTTLKERWYLAVQPAAIFLLLFVFFRVIYNQGTAFVWYWFLMDVFGITFAILIIIYLSSLFSWRTVGLFALLLTLMDITLVIVTPVMVTAATTFTGLGLPVLVQLPQVPIYETAQGIAIRGLGLGDFFFAGVLAVQADIKFGRKTAIISAIGMTLAFGLWEAYLGDIINWINPIVGRDIAGFPGTVMIVTGWIPVVAWKLLSERRKKAAMPVVNQAPMETPKEASLPVE
jgi:hypothetical protein